MNNANQSELDHKRAKVVEQVRALLSQATSTTYEAEAQTFESKAIELMARYQIEERELRDANPEHNIHVIPCGHFGHAQYAATTLCAEVAKLFGGYGVRLRRDRKMSVRMSTTESQFELAKPLIDHLLAQMMIDLNHERPQSRKDYSIGWADRVLDRLETAQATVYSTSNALVPSDNAAKAALVELHGKPRSPRSVEVGVDYLVGRIAGGDVDLHQRQIT